jgi:hypothetical protein
MNDLIDVAGSRHGGTAMTEAEEVARRVKWDERRSLSMHRLSVPNRPQLLEALGRLAIAHTHLERTLRYTVKTLSGLSGPKSLDPAKRKPISDLRKRIKKRFKKHHPTAAETYRLDELLEKAKLLSGKRNSYMHRAWSETEAGQVILLEEDLRL